MEQLTVPSSPSQCKMMHRRNVRRAIQSTVLCLSLVYVSALVVWSSSSNSSSQSSSSTANQNDTSSRSAEGTQRSTQLLNSSSHHNRQLKNHLPYEEALPAMPPTPSALNDLTKAAERRTLRTSLEDIFLSVKTTRIFHPTRLEVILNTWFRLAKNQVRLHHLLHC